MFRVTIACSVWENVLLWLGKTEPVWFIFRLYCNISLGPYINKKNSLWLNGISGWYST